MDTIDTVTLDVPLLIRLLEHAREDIKTDQQLHEVATRVVSKSKQKVLTMVDYEYLAGVPKSVEQSTLKRLQGNI